MRDLKERALRGGVARLINLAVTFALRLGSVAVMSRLLAPKEFGLVAMATVVIGIYDIFTSAGLSSATVQREEIDDSQVSALFWINMLVGSLLFLLSVATAPLLASFYNEPRLLWITLALAVGFIFNAAGVQHSALLQRHMRFKAMAVIEVISLTISIAVGVAMALSDCGYWAIVGMTLSSPAIATLCKWKATGFVPGRPRPASDIPQLLRFGGVLTLHSLVYYVAYNVEKVLIGRFWGAAMVGLYVRAFYMINVPTDSLNSVTAAVAFSALSRIQHEPERLKRYFLNGYSLVLSMTLPITIFCAVFADQLVYLFLGAQWKEAVPIFRLMTPTVLVFGLIYPWSWLLQSIGMQMRALKIALLIAPVVIASYIVGLPFGPKGVALAHSAAMVLLVVPVLHLSRRGTLFSWKDILVTITPPLVSGVAGGLCSVLFRLYCPTRLHPFLLLSSGGLLMCAAYLAVLLFGMGQKEFYLDVLKGLRKRTPEPGEGSAQA